MTTLKRHVCKVFKINGLAITSDGVNYLSELLEPIRSDEHDQWIDKVIEAVQKLPLKSSMIDLDNIQKAALEVSSSENDEIGALLQIVNIFKVPKLTYDIKRRKFCPDELYTPSFHGNADEKAFLFKNRYTVTYQRTINHDLFRPSITGNNREHGGRFGLVKVEYLLGVTSKATDLVVLGLLTQMTEGGYHLEDDTGAVKVDLRKAKFHTGLFTQNCFVLIEGTFDDKVLHANAVGLPPAETASTTRALLGNINYFGGKLNSCPIYLERIRKKEAENSEAMIVFMSDVWLDKLKVVEKLNTLFRGYAQFPPTAFVFCGNFLSASHGNDPIGELSAAFSTLADSIASFPGLTQNSMFIFVPGPNDPGPGNIFPRPPLPSSVIGDFRKKVPTSRFVSNPCRFTYCTQEIVVFREDIFTKMCRNAVYFPEDSSKITSYFCRTIVSQAHLSPLPLHTVPVYWGLDHSLSLHPTPDVIITADKGNPFTEHYNGATVINPGSFMKTDFAFKVYMPSTRETEDSQIVDDEAL